VSSMRLYPVIIRIAVSAAISSVRAARCSPVESRQYGRHFESFFCRERLTPLVLGLKIKIPILQNWPTKKIERDNQ
jgi:hypothetical protein